MTHFGTVPGAPALPSARHRNSIPARSELGTEPSHEAASATDSSSNLGAELGFTGRAGFSGVLEGSALLWNSQEFDFRANSQTR